MGNDLAKDIFDSYRDVPKARIPYHIPVPPPRPEPPRPQLELPVYEPPSVPPPKPEYNPDCNPVVIWESDSMTVISYKGPRYDRNHDW